ncbi:DUF3658 domain-containing protein [Hansschlegelia quercus]|uniref:DUF1835 domain-containing protein n=1 Tax=Hansschlegelia quercus TaxID=2528245 RepID=A0A4Q9GKT3_9HYPH|nr:DUF3658 domain-containing protein [Hansschlegelia quercus]TBN54822.1 DUF1835 domain-containing protein [Hansschlegelia quercus]
MARATRHIVFSPSARSSLLQALKAVGRKDDVVALFDDLRCGPLEPLDPVLRGNWFSDVLGVDFEAGLVPLWHQEFWSQSLDPNYRLIAWTNRYATQDHLGFLAWASRLGELPGQVCDISDIDFEWTDREGNEHRQKLSVSLVPPVHFSLYNLFDQARPLRADERTEAAAEWRRIGTENGAFRAVFDGRLTSLPITAFDEALISATSTTLRKAAFVVGTVLWDMGEAAGWCVGDLALAARLAAIVEDGRLEAVGDISRGIRYWEVRRTRQNLPDQSSQNGAPT